MQRVKFSRYFIPLAAITLAGLVAVPAQASDIKGYTTDGDAACWTNPTCSLPRGGDSDVMTVFNSDGSIFRQIFAFGGEAGDNAYYFSALDVQVDAAQYGFYSTLLKPDGVIWSDTFGVGFVSGAYYLTFASGPRTNPDQPIPGLTFVASPDILNPVPAPDRNNQYLTIGYDATHYLSESMKAAGYTATFRSDITEPGAILRSQVTDSGTILSSGVPEPGTIALMGLAIGSLARQRRRRRGSQATA